MVQWCIEATFLCCSKSVGSGFKYFLRLPVQGLEIRRLLHFPIVSMWNNQFIYVRPSKYCWWELVHPFLRHFFPYFSMHVDRFLNWFTCQCLCPNCSYLAHSRLYSGQEILSPILPGGEITNQRVSRSLVLTKILLINFAMHLQRTLNLSTQEKAHFLS